MSNGKRIPKIAVEVELTRVDGTKSRGFVFISANERVLDMLNAAGPFFPFRDAASKRVQLCAKAAVACVEPLDQKG
ncbi:MAG TPA: hypothetical protein VEU47_02975 [Candidatus Cybelea sp.]|nr:hypothetical protein [Candidatus Cybelea sp.]